MLDQEMRPIFRLLCFLAWSDSKIATEERHLILEMVEQVDLSADLKVEIEIWLKSGCNSEGIFSQISRREDQKFALLLMKQLAACDGQVSQEETELIEKAVQEFGLSQEELEEVDAAMSPSALEKSVREIVKLMAEDRSSK